MPIEIKNLSIKINIANNDAPRQSFGENTKKKALKKESVIQLVEQIHKLKNER